MESPYKHGNRGWVGVCVKETENVRDMMNK